MTQCPFNDPNFMIDTSTPCPVCGVRAFPFNTMEEIDDKCVEGLLGEKQNETQSASSTSTTR